MIIFAIHKPNAWVDSDQHKQEESGASVLSAKRKPGPCLVPPLARGPQGPYVRYLEHGQAMDNGGPTCTGNGGASGFAANYTMYHCTPPSSIHTFSHSVTDLAGGSQEEATSPESEIVHPPVMLLPRPSNISMSLPPLRSPAS